MLFIPRKEETIAPLISDFRGLLAIAKQLNFSYSAKAKANQTNELDCMICFLDFVRFRLPLHRSANMRLAVERRSELFAASQHDEFRSLLTINQTNCATNRAGQGEESEFVQ